MRIGKVTGFWTATVLSWLFFVSTAFGLETYDTKVIAQTGVAVGGGTPVALGQGPSINDAGKVAFIARDSAGQRGRVMLLNNGVVERNYPVGAPATVEDYVQANDIDQVVFRQGFDDGLVSYIQRLDTVSGGESIAIGSLTPVFTASFDVVLPWATLNDSGRGVFSADIGSTTVLGTRVGGTGTHSVSPGLTGYPNLYPMLADNDTTVVRWGSSSTSPLLRFINTNLDAANFIAESTDFNAVGEQPGISDDGNVVAFMGAHKTQGVGIFISLFTGSSYTPVKIVGGADGFSAFSLQPRVGVNRSLSSSAGEYTVVFIGYDSLGVMGLYGTAVNVSNPASPQVLKTTLISKVGGTINGVPGKVNNIKIYDPVNNNGQIAFWVSTDGGSQAIVRVSPVMIDAFDPACESFLNDGCKGQYLKVQDGQVRVDETKLDAIVLSGIQRKGITTDGVTALLLRIKTSEAVTFVLKDTSGQTANSRWGELSDVAGTVQGNTLTATPTLTNEGPAVFVVYHAPMDLPCSYNTELCTQSEIAGGLQVTVSASSATKSWSRALNLLPPPLVFVHGVWSNGEAWLKMSEFLGQRGFSVYPGCLVDYGRKSPAGPFDPLAEDKYIIKETITSTKRVLASRRAADIAATQVDVIGHSMGGLVARSMVAFNDVEDQFKAVRNYNKGSIHKIITVGTPHWGTQIADFLIRNKCSSWAGVGISLEDFFNNVLKRPIGPAIFGFETTSPDLLHLGVTDVPSRAIVGLAPDSSLTETALTVLVKTFVSPSESIDYLLDFNGAGHDTIVPRESQEGGLPPLAVTSNNGIVHAALVRGDIDETLSTDVWTEVLRSLQMPTISLAFSSIPLIPGGSPTYPVNPYLSPEAAACPAQSVSATPAAASSATSTLTPSAGTTFTPGTSVNVTFSVSGGNPVEGALFAVGNKLEVINGTGPFSFSFPAPADYLGDMDITAFTFGPGPENYTAATTITILPSGPFTRIAADPNTMFFDQKNLALQLNVRGYYADGTSVNITRAGAGTVYATQSGTTNVVVVSPDGLFEGKGIGSETVVITNRGQTTTVPVEVKYVNHPPQFSAISNQTVVEGNMLAFDVAAVDPDADPITLTARLVNGDPLSSIGANFTDQGNGTGSFTWQPTFTQAGTYNILFQANDGESTVDSSMTVTVTDASQADLILTAVSSTTVNISSTSVFSVSSTAKNQGSAAAGAFVIGFHLSQDAVYGGADDIVLTATRSVASLNPGAVSSGSTQLTIPATTPTGNYYVCAQADSAGAVGETNEGNNTRCKTGTILVAPADLIVTAISGPANGITGSSITLNDTVTNQGAGLVSSLTMGYYLSTDAAITTADTRIGTRSVTSLAAGTSKSGSVNVTIPATLAPGNYYIGAIADYNNLRPESDETNNASAGNIIAAGAGADLVMTGISGPATSVTGASIAVNYTAANQGSGLSGNFTVGYYLSTDAAITTADTRIGTATVTSLASGAVKSGTVNLTIPATLLPGNYYIGAIADYNNARVESDETNNAFTGNAITVTPGADLVMTAVSGPASATRGTAFVVNNTVDNQGTGAAASFNVGIYLSADPVITTSDRRLASRSVSSLAVGASNSAATNVTIPATVAAGTYYIGTIADFANTRAESNESNNALTGNTVTVQ